MHMILWEGFSDWPSTNLNVFLDFRLQRTKKLKRKIGSSPLADRQVRFFSPKNFSVAQFNFFAFRGVLPFFSAVGELFFSFAGGFKKLEQQHPQKNCPYDQNHLSLSLCNTALVGWSRLLSQLRRNVTLVASIVRSLSRSIEDHLEKVPGNRENEKKFKSLRYLRFLTISYYRLPCRAWAARALPGWA